MLRLEVCHISELKGLRTSNLVHRWSTKTRIADKRHEMTTNVKGEGQVSSVKCQVVRLTGVSRK